MPNTVDIANENIKLGGVEFVYAPASSLVGQVATFADTTGSRLVGSNAFPQSRTVLTGATVLTAAQSGSLCLWNAAAGYLFTLPAPTVGLWFDFLVSTTCTSVGDKVITNAGTVFIGGALWQGIANTTPGANPGPKLFVADGSTAVAINMFGVSSDTTTGGVAGSGFRLTCTSSTLWTLSNALVLATGTIATPIATS